MNNSLGDPKARTVLKFTGFDGKFYECVFFHEFQAEAAFKMINQGNGLQMIDPTSVIKEERGTI